MPMTISTILDSSPRPKTMNRIGRIASGGIIEMTATNGAERRADDRQEADREPEDEADRASRCRARSASRCRLAAVSAHSR